MTTKPEYRAVHAHQAVCLHPVEDMPSHVQRITVDEHGRRVTQIIAICDSTGLDNDAMVDEIATALNEREVRPER